MTVLLETRQLAYGHPGRTIGSDINLAIHAGEVHCVLGPNGGGKTTLFRTLLGLIPAQGGDVYLAGQTLTELSPPDRARLVAYVPQASPGYFSFTVREAVLMGRTAHLSLFAQPGEKDRVAVEAALSELRITHLADKSFTHISAGERQLALIARALAQESSLLILDEPTASLDVGNQVLILNEIQRLKNHGHSILFCTHNPDHALQAADQALLLHKGNALAQGKPNEIVTAENLKTLYGVDVPMKLCSRMAIELRR